MKDIKGVLKEKGDKKVSNLREKRQLIGFKDLMDTEFPPACWKVDQLIPFEGITIISGAPGVFKTWLTLEMALDIAQGKSFLEQFPCQSGSILIIDEESHQRILQERLRLLGAVSKSLPIHFLSQSEFMVSDSEKLMDVIDLCKRLSVDTVFIDSLVRIHRSNENDAVEMAGVFRALRKLCGVGITVILIHHERKESASNRSSGQNRMRGSSDISASIDSHIAISRTKEDKYRLVLEQPKNRQSQEIEAFEVQVRSDENEMRFEHLGVSHGCKWKIDEAKEAIIQILQEHSGGLSKGEIAKQLKETIGIGSTSVYASLKALVQEGTVGERSGNGRTLICSLKSVSSQAEGD